MISLTTLEQRLGDELESCDALTIVDLESAAVAWFQRQTERYFGPLIETEKVLRGNGTRRLYLPELPRISPDPDSPVGGLADYVSITEQRWPADPEAAVIDPGSDEGWAIRPREWQDGELVRKGRACWRLYHDYVMQAWIGYPWINEEIKELGAPDDVREAVIKLISLWFRGQDFAGVTGPLQERIDNYSYTYASLPSEMQQLYDIVTSTVERWKGPYYPWASVVA